MLHAIGLLLQGAHGVANATDLKRIDGYRIISYLLLRAAEKGRFDSGVLDSIFELVTGAKAGHEGLVSDCDAARYILLNHAMLLRIFEFRFSKILEACT